MFELNSMKSKILFNIHNLLNLKNISVMCFVTGYVVSKFSRL